MFPENFKLTRFVSFFLFFHQIVGQKAIRFDDLFPLRELNCYQGKILQYLQIKPNENYSLFNAMLMLLRPGSPPPLNIIGR